MLRYLKIDCIGTYSNNLSTFPLSLPKLVF